MATQRIITMKPAFIADMQALSPKEVDEARVHDRYLIGMLAPNKTQTVPEDLDELGDAEEGGIDEGAAEKDATQKPSFNPASLGMSFSVDGDTT